MGFSIELKTKQLPAYRKQFKRIIASGMRFYPGSAGRLTGIDIRRIKSAEGAKY